MSQGTVGIRLSNAVIAAAIFAELLRHYQAPVVPNVYLPKGTVVGLVSSASAAEVQTVTPGAAPASGAWSFQVQYPAQVKQSVVMQWNANLATVQAAFDGVFGAGNTVISGSFATHFTITYAGTLATGNQPAITILTNTLQTVAPAAVVLTVATTTAGVKKGALGAYASGNTDGTQDPVGILDRDVYTGPDGLITLGAQPGLITGPTAWSARYIIGGYVRTEDLVGLDAGAVSALGRVIAGDTTQGILAVY